MDTLTVFHTVIVWKNFYRKDILYRCCPPLSLSSNTIKGKIASNHQKASATMTVLGTDGPHPGGDQPPVRTTVTVVLTGVNGVGAGDRRFDTTSDKTVAEALQEGLGEDYTLTVSGYG